MRCSGSLATVRATRRTTTNTAPASSASFTKPNTAPAMKPTILKRTSGDHHPGHHEQPRVEDLEGGAGLLRAGRPAMSQGTAGPRRRCIVPEDEIGLIGAGCASSMSSSSRSASSRCSSDGGAPEKASVSSSRRRSAPVGRAAPIWPARRRSATRSRARAATAARGAGLFEPFELLGRPRQRLVLAPAATAIGRHPHQRPRRDEHDDRDRERLRRPARDVRDPGLEERRQPGAGGRRVRIAGERHLRGRVERLPADAGEPDLGPRVRVLAPHLPQPRERVALAGREADRQPGRARRGCGA